MNRRSIILLAGLVIIGCSRGPQELAPPEVQFGQTNCSECGMTVGDEHYAAAEIVETPKGERLGKVFDDIGCMLAYEREQRDGKVLSRWVKDYDSRQWLPALEAVYVRGERIHSPMAYGILAAANVDEAAKLARAKGGRTLNLLALQSAEHPATAAAR